MTRGRLQRCPCCGLCQGCALQCCLSHPASLQGHFSEGGWVGHCRGSAGTAHCIRRPAGIPGRTAAGGSGRQRCGQECLPACVCCGLCQGCLCSAHNPPAVSLTEGHCRRVVGTAEAALAQRIAYAGRQAFLAAPLQGGPAGSGMTRGRLPACVCCGLCQGCLCSAPPTQPHCRDTAVRVGGTGSAAERIAGAGRRRGAAAGGSWQAAVPARNALQRCPCCGLCQGCALQCCLSHPASLR